MHSLHESTQTHVRAVRTLKERRDKSGGKAPTIPCKTRTKCTEECVQYLRSQRGRGDKGASHFFRTSCVMAVRFRIKVRVPSPEDGVAAGAGVTGAKPGLLFVEDAGDICLRDNCGRDAFCGSNDAKGSSRALSFLNKRERLSVNFKQHQHQTH